MTKKTAAVRIIFVLPVQSPYYSKRLACLALHRDLDITLLLEQSTLAHRPGWKPEPIDNVRVEVLAGGAVLASKNKGDDIGYPVEGVRTLPWKLPVALWRKRPEITVLCNTTQLALALPVKWLLGIRLVLIVEDTPHARRNAGSLSRLIRNWLLRRADSWFAFSDDAKCYLEQVGISQGVLRSSWSLDMKDFRRLSVQEHGGIQGTNRLIRRTVIFVGSLVLNKGVMILLDSWRRLSLDVRLRSRLLIVGTGPLEQEIVKFIRLHLLDEVELLGQVPYESIKSYFCSSDLVVLPTLQDLFSLTILEAMACGCPVITTPFNGARELVSDGINGWIVDPHKPGALRSVLENALEMERTHLGRMGHAARLRVEGMDNMVVMTKFARDLYDLEAVKR